jgi:uncharacterized protein (TIGR02271 family)
MVRAKKISSNTVVGVFHSHNEAQQAIQRLKENGFTDEQISVITRNQEGSFAEQTDETMAEEGATIGATAGLATGALWGIGIAAGLLPAIGPVIAGGTLAAILASAGTAAAAGGVVGGLIGLGIPEEEAEYYEGEFERGRTIVTVKCDSGDADRVRQIMDSHNVYDYQRRESEYAANPQASERLDMHGRMVARKEIADVDKHTESAGEARVRKEVHTETRHMEVPVKREELVIERTALNEATAGEIDGDACQEERITLNEEVVDVNKKTVAKEAVKVGKRTVTDKKQVDVELKEEEIVVDKNKKRKK